MLYFANDFCDLQHIVYCHITSQTVHSSSQRLYRFYTLIIWPHTVFSQCRSMCANNIHFVAQEFETCVLNSSHEQISQKRRELFDAINGEIFYVMRHWPNSMERMFWKKPLSDEHCTIVHCTILARGNDFSLSQYQC